MIDARVEAWRINQRNAVCDDKNESRFISQMQTWVAFGMGNIPGYDAK